MDLQMSMDAATAYRSSSQKIRVITEHWAKENLYCPCCGNGGLNHFVNNSPVADFFCPQCQEEYELKSKAGTVSGVVSDGAYNTMISRINATNNPNFFFMRYEKNSLKIKDLIVVPKYFVVPDIIEKRKPLAETARRAGWVGCNIVVRRIPEEGKIFLVKDEDLVSADDVVKKVQKTRFLMEYTVSARGWILDVLNCVNRIPSRDFSLKEIYHFADELQVKYPDNHHIKDKIRQQLQILRDKGVLEFKGAGNYRKI